MATRIVFHGGAEVEVADSPQEVGKAFGQETGAVFTTLRKKDGSEVIVNPDAVAYLEAAGSAGPGPAGRST